MYLFANYAWPRWMSNELNSEESQKSKSLEIVIALCIAISTGTGIGMHNIAAGVGCGAALFMLIRHMVRAYHN